MGKNTYIVPYLRVIWGRVLPRFEKNTVLYKMTDGDLGFFCKNVKDIVYHGNVHTYLEKNILHIKPFPNELLHVDLLDKKLVISGE